MPIPCDTPIGVPILGSMTAIRWLRWMTVAIALCLGLVLINSHHLLVGSFVLTSAAARGSVLVIVRKRRAALRARRRRRLGRRTLILRFDSVSNTGRR